ETFFQIKLAIKDEVEYLEKAGINVIQIDEAALGRVASKEVGACFLYGLGCPLLQDYQLWCPRYYPDPYPHALLKFQ
ncbi:unnamed protein product, partial [Linum tenue]